ncbi:M23 family metallopeptidase [Paracoccus sediminicola]|uniref:M23 family metallopeptidase n=1 Tax=Paracoccus sediminicola TaxID=3017783 RepID=UPI0022F010F5|nr:M23 family metallopeptidase [Paracoccus sediminicola]WBU58221.1 M23 family metallopeptidase [Paracoccus sediminicola]
MSRMIFRGTAAVSLAALLAGCQAFPVVQQDLAGITGGSAGAGTSGAGTPAAADPAVAAGGGGRATSLPGFGGTAASRAGSEAASARVTDPFAGQGVAQPDVPGGPGAQRASGSNDSDSNAATGPATTHRVVSGETGWSVARKYGISIQQLADANSLDENMTLRVGQELKIPGTGGSGGDDASAPGQGTPTPTPPSASRPLPDEETAPSSTPTPKPDTPDLGATRTTASGSGKFRMPVAGSIVRTYSKGSNEGIDISAPAGTAVSAAGAGRVAAITRDTDGVPIVVLRHEGELMTVYAGLDQLSVQKGDQVTAGQQLGTAGNSGTLHFEIRQGFESVDPEDYL